MEGKAKGALMLGVVKALRSQRAQAEPKLTGPLRRYLEERVIATGWYPEADYWGLVGVLAELTGIPGLRAWQELGRIEAHTHLGSTYSAVGSLEQSDPWRITRRLKQLWELQHDEGEVVCTMEGDGHARIEVIDYVLPGEGPCAAITGYFGGVYEILGRPEVEVSHDHCRYQDGLTCTWAVRW